jgi:hypothetical protein
VIDLSKDTPPEKYYATVEEYSMRPYADMNNSGREVTIDKLE